MKYRKLKGYKFQLMKMYRVKVELPGDDVMPVNHPFNRYLNIRKGVLTIKKWYSWDGSSIPLKKYYKWLWDSDKYCKTSSLVHDGLCQLMRESLLAKSYKQYIDALYRDMSIAGGMSKWQANLRYWVLRKFGDVGIEKRKNPRGIIYDT